MRLRIFKICITVFISVALIASVYKIIQACSFGEWDDCDLANYSFFDPRIINQPEVTPFFVTCHSLYSYNNDYQAMDKLNAREWSEYLNFKLDSNDVLAIFSMQTVMLDSLYNFYYKINPTPPQTEWVNTIAVKMASLDNTPAIDYLKFSKKIERLMWGNSIWDYEGKVVDTALYIRAIGDAKNEIKKSKSSFLKTRYTFQVQRILFYLNRYNECADWYLENEKVFKSAGSITWRSLAYYAGCLYHQKRYDESNYIFSLIYDQFPVMKVDAFTSFHPWEDADWNATLKRAKSNHEKEVLWQLFGVYADPLKGMKEIYAINSQSKMMDLLLTRSINIIERNELANDNYENQYGDEETNPVPDTSFKRRIFDSSESFNAFNNITAKDELESFINMVVGQGKTHNPCLWLNAIAYLNWMNKKYDVAEKYLGQAKLCSNIDNLNQSQLAITDLLIQFGKIEKLTPATEQQLYQLLYGVTVESPNDRSQAVYNYIMDKLSGRYTQSGNLLMAELCNNGRGSFYSDEIKFDEMLQFMRKPGQSDFEKLLLKNYYVKPADIIEYRAVQELKANRFDEAVKWFEQDNASGNKELYGNPFTIHITDCHDCDHSAPQKTKYTKSTFALKLKELLANAESSKDADEKAQNYFLLANGLYNLTYYGNARMVSLIYPFMEKDWGNYYSGDDYLKGGCDRPMLYYQKAMSYSTRKEFKAKCAWMSAKCELNNWYATKDYEEGSRDFFESDNYKLLKEHYSDTKYYSEIIAECGYFCSYNGGGDKCIRNK